METPQGAVADHFDHANGKILKPHTSPADAMKRNPDAHRRWKRPDRIKEQYVREIRSKLEKAHPMKARRTETTPDPSFIKIAALVCLAMLGVWLAIRYGISTPHR